MQDGSAKQLVTERIKNATNILVTVSANPSVDELSAALGLTMMLNKLDKHGTAVFSGQLPPAINFLEPAKTFESTVDSLRDFIIALDKEKADRLRYKVEDDVVRIFITPYRTTITQDDLQFSQGDFNVELIIALGVEKREDLDTAITAHGRILHDATVVTINARDEKSSLGSVDWQDTNASSLCEMLVSISEALGTGLLDQQIANALLTGIVAATDRFSNLHTTPRVMTMAAQLMAAGANQQLIATQLQEANEIPTPGDDGSTRLKEGDSQKLAKNQDDAKKKKSGADGEMQVSHDPVEQRSAAAATAASELAQKAEAATHQSQEEENLSKHLDTVAPASVPLPDVHKDLEKETAQYNPLHDEPSIKSQPSWKGRNIEPPTMGGVLNATTEEAMEEKLDAEADERNHKLLSHDHHDTPPPAFNNYSEKESTDGVASELEDTDDKADAKPAVEKDEESAPQPASIADLPMPAYEPTPEPAHAQPEPAKESSADHEPTLAELVTQAHSAPQEKKLGDGLTLAELEAQAHAHAAEAATQLPIDKTDHVDQARAAVSDALNALPFDPARNPVESLGATPLPSINQQPAVEVEQPLVQPEFSLPPLPDMSTLPPLPTAGAEQASPQSPSLPQESQLDQFTDPHSTNPADGPQSPKSNDPGQFKIPGQ